MKILIPLLFLFSSCASHHAKGYVLSKTSKTEGIMSVESDSVEVGDKLKLFHEKCRYGVRGLLICENLLVGEAEVKSISDDDRAEFQLRAPASFGKGDYLEAK